jgi:sugar phosphate isomerase/epimerase
MLAVSSWSWHDAYYAGQWSLLDLPAAAAAAGLTAIECNDFMLPPPRISRVRQPLLALLPGAPPELWRYSRATLQQLQASAQASGVTILTWTINSDFAAPAHHWPAQQLYLWRGLAAARLLETSLLRVNLGGSPATPPGRDSLVRRRLIRFARTALGRCPGLALTVENHWGLSTDIERHLRLVDGVAAALSPGHQRRFGCCFDPANVPEEPGRERWWRELAARANHYHLKTTTFDASGNDTGLPHRYLFELLQRAGYRGSVSIEFAGDGDAAEGVLKSVRLYKQSGAPDPGPSHRVA